MEPEDVTHLPKPLSPRNRNRVRKVEPTYRSHNVQYLPKEHTPSPNPFVAQAWPKPPNRSTSKRAETPAEQGFRVVAPTRFELALPA